MKEKRYDPSSLKVFVFGSNKAGIHGAGAALYARTDLKAELGVGRGPMPHSIRPRCYAIPTKDERLHTLSIEEIRAGVDEFIDFAQKRPDLQFFVTRIGCGLAGYTDHDIAPLFVNAPSNCELPNGWERDGFCH